MKKCPFLTIASLIVLAALCVAARPRAVAYEHLVVQVPYAEAVQTEFQDFAKVPPKIKKRTVLDSLGEQGWELVSAVQDRALLTCFFKRPR